MTGRCGRGQATSKMGAVIMYVLHITSISTYSYIYYDLTSLMSHLTRVHERVMKTKRKRSLESGLLICDGFGSLNTNP